MTAPTTFDLPTAVTQEHLEHMARSFNDFGLRLLARLAMAPRAPRNLAIAPFAIASELTMTQLGAGGETAAAFAHLLRLDSAHHGSIQAAARALLDAVLGADPQASLLIANSLWVEQQYPVAPAYVQLAQTHFGAHVGAFDRREPDAGVDAINHWVQAETQGKIDRIADVADLDGAALLLFSAIYFKAAWMTMFDHADTAPASFTRADGSTCTAPFMHLRTRLTHRRIDDVQLVFLPFSAGRLGMLLALPPLIQPLRDFQRMLDAATWSEWLQDFSEGEGELALPRFSVRSAFHLDQTLQAMGLQVAFSSEADFHKIGPGNLVVADVQHAAMLEVNEEGAVASTAKEQQLFRGALHQPLKIVFDRTFLAAIVDTETEVIVFAGYIGDPSTVQQ